MAKNFDLRAYQHSRDGRAFTPTPIRGAEGLTLGEARVIEEMCIVRGGAALENQRHSISPSAEYYDDALAYAPVLMKKLGAKCPTANR